MKTFYGLIGAGGYGREVLPVMMAQLRDKIDDGEIEVSFIVEQKGDLFCINNYPVMDLSEFFALQSPKKFNIAISDSKTRQRIAESCLQKGIDPFSIISPNAVLMDENDISYGSIFSPFVTITSNTKIGRFFHANIYSYVAHDCVIGDYVTFAPGVKCNGNVVVGDHAYIGTGAVIRQGSQNKPLRVGDGAVVGMGAVVTKDVPPYATVVGNPARVLEK